MNDEQLLKMIDQLRVKMISVSTGGDSIPDVNDDFRKTYGLVAAALVRKQITNPIPYGDLWDWWARCKSGDLPTYVSRRQLVGEIFNPLINQIQSGRPEEIEPTGWPRVDRAMGEVRTRLASAASEEQFQAVGLLYREVLISLAQAVYDPTKHKTIDGVEPSDTDGKRMLEAYISTELGGGPNEATRKHARSALELAIALQHRRTAAFRDAAMCSEATASVVNLLAIVSGRRDPTP